jgi:sulfite dehydrogenase (quinone) subunit SoeA
LISDLLPEREGGYRYSNSDPVTGQAAWYDLKVRVEKAVDQSDESAPQFPTLSSPALLAGEGARRANEGPRVRSSNP